MLAGEKQAAAKKEAEKSGGAGGFLTPADCDVGASP